jgi:hypothetical protein
VLQVDLVLMRSHTGAEKEVIMTEKSVFDELESSAESAPLEQKGELNNLELTSAFADLNASLMAMASMVQDLAFGLTQAHQKIAELEEGVRGAAVTIQEKIAEFHETAVQPHAVEMPPEQEAENALAHAELVGEFVDGKFKAVEK